MLIEHHSKPLYTLLCYYCVTTARDYTQLILYALLLIEYQVEKNSFRRHVSYDFSSRRNRLPKA